MIYPVFGFCSQLRYPGIFKKFKDLKRERERETLIMNKKNSPKIIHNKYCEDLQFPQMKILSPDIYIYIYIYKGN